MKLPTITLLFLLTSTLSHANNLNNYFELGLGASKLFSFNSEDNDYLKEYSVSPSVKFLAGGRLNQSRTLWFEYGYSYNGEMKYEDTKLKVSSGFLGFKLTTDPIENTSFFTRLGLGKTLVITKTVSEPEDESESTHYYGAAGISFRLTTEQSLVLELHHLNDEGSDQAINGLFLNFNQYL